MIKPLAYSFTMDDEAHCGFDDFSVNGLLQYMLDQLGAQAIAEWIASAVPSLTADAIINEYEGGLLTWWGTGSVFFCELGLVVNIKMTDKILTITVV